MQEQQASLFNKEKNMRALLMTKKQQWWWQPDPSRTIFYYDFEDSSNRLADNSWNWNNASWSSYITYTEVWWQNVAQTTQINSWININSAFASSIWTWDFAMSCWIYIIDPWSWRYPLLFWTRYDSNTWWIVIFFDPYNVNGKWNHIVYNDLWTNPRPWSITASTLYNNWHNFVVTRINWTVYCYIDCSLDLTFTDNNSFASSWTWALLSRPTSWAPQSFPALAKWDKFILEKVWWTVDDIVNYYNNTKSIYWIS